MYQIMTEHEFMTNEWLYGPKCILQSSKSSVANVQKNFEDNNGAWD